MYILNPIALTPSMFTNNNVPVNDFAAWNAATNYTVGTKVIRTTTNKIYRNLIAGIDATFPESAPTRWFDEGYVNAYKMIDDLSSSQSVAPNGIVFTINLNQRISSLAFINLVGTSLTITATNAGAEQIYNKTISLDASSVSSIYDWFFEPFTQKTDHFEVDFPQTYLNPYITITILNESGNAAIGRFICAKSYKIGTMQYGSSVGIKDYSIKTTDSNNISYLTKKDNAKLMSFKLVLNQSETNRVVKLLRQLLSVPCVFIGVSDDGYEYTIAHGFYQSFKIPLQTPSVNYCELEIEELI